MRVEVVQKGKEGPIGRPPGQPIQESIIELLRTARLKGDPLLVVEVAETQDILEDPVARDRAGEDRPRRKRVIIEMVKAPTQAKFVAATACVGGEPRGLVALGPEEFRQGKARGIKSELVLATGLERPLAGKKAGM